MTNHPSTGCVRIGGRKPGDRVRRRAPFPGMLSVWLVACASSSPPEPPVFLVDPHGITLEESWMLGTLASLSTRDEMIALLGAGLPASELQYEGFDQVTLAECIDEVVNAALHDRGQNASPSARSELIQATHRYFVRLREGNVRRRAGAATCLPSVR